MKEPTGGSFVVGEDGVRRRIESTQDHPAGNRPRDAKGHPLGEDGKPLERRVKPRDAVPAAADENAKTARRERAVKTDPGVS